MHICSMCGSKNTEVKAEKKQFDYKGNSMAYDSFYVECEECGFEFVPFKFKKDEETQKANFRRQSDSLLTSDEIFAIRKKHGLTQEYASRIFGGGKNAFSKYERCEVTQSRAMDKLLRLVREEPTNVELLKRLESDSYTFDSVEKVRTKLNHRVDLTEVKVAQKYYVYTSCEEKSENNTYELRGDVVRLGQVGSSIRGTSSFSKSEDEYAYH